jgi:hypothetical protein
MAEKKPFDLFLAAISIYFLGARKHTTVSSSARLIVSARALLQVDIISSLMSGRLVREKVGPAVHSAVRSQVPLPTQPSLPLKCTNVMLRFIQIDQHSTYKLIRVLLFFLISDVNFYYDVNKLIILIFYKH